MSKTPYKKTLINSRKFLLAYLLTLATGVVFALLIHDKADKDYEIALEHYKKTSYNEAKKLPKN
jgi:hypothetical protein